MNGLDLTDISSINMTDKDFTYIIIYNACTKHKHYSGSKIDAAYWIYMHPERNNTYTYKCPKDLITAFIEKWENKDADFFKWIKDNKIRKVNENKLYKYVYD